MAIGTRDYARSYISYQSRLPTGIKWLLIANVVMFVLQSIDPRTTGSYLLAYLGLIPHLAVERFFIWQFVTYMFLHGNVMHILFNLLALWMFGTELEQTWGTRRFLRFYFICGIGAGVVVTIIGYLTNNTQIPTIGCSAAIYGILMAWAVLWPTRIILFMFVFPMQVRWMVIIYGALAFYGALGANAGVSNVGHLSGLAIGYVLLKMPRTVRRGTTAISGGAPIDRMRHRYRQWKMERAKRKFQLYLNKHRSDRGGPFVN